DLTQRGDLRLVAAQRPEFGREAARSRFHQRGDKDMMGAKADAMAAQQRARGLVEVAQYIGQTRPLDDAERLDELKADAARRSGQRFIGLDVEKRLEGLAQPCVEKKLQAGGDL